MTAQTPFAGGVYGVQVPSDLCFCEADQTASVRYLDSFAKRAVDVSLSLALLLFLSPLLILIAAAIVLDSKGPVLYRQQRFGRGGVPFWILKFRSMRVCEDAGSFKQATRGDSRITRVGRFIRATSLDELPQLVNVLRGDMSLVGPRPHAIAMDLQHMDIVPNYRRRFAARPGITGLAQVSGARGETPTIGHVAERIRHDLIYVSSASLFADIKILARTVREVLLSKVAF